MIKVKDGKLQAELLDNKGTLSNKIIEQYDYIELKNDFAEILDILSTNMLVHAMYQEALKYEITEEIGILSESAKGWTKELNLISWNDREPKYDIREWAPDHEKMGKGVTLSIEEVKSLKALLNSIDI